jgi:hypothetical protein
LKAYDISLLEKLIILLCKCGFLKIKHSKNY